MKQTEGEKNQFVTGKTKLENNEYKNRWTDIMKKKNDAITLKSELRMKNNICKDK